MSDQRVGQSAGDLEGTKVADAIRQCVVSIREAAVHAEERIRPLGVAAAQLRLGAKRQA